MKLGTILTATDATPLYADFIPMFIRAWSLVAPEADICILYVAESLPASLAPYATFIRVVPPIAGMHTAFQAQCLRLLTPREITRDEGVLITDMDMIPLSRSYYVDTIRPAPTDAFVVYRDVCLPAEISMCYNAAHPATWTSVFGSAPTETLLREWYGGTGYDGVHGGRGWNTDQLILVRELRRWSGQTLVHSDAQTKFRRLCRSFPPETWTTQRSQLRRLIRSGVFADYHCLRPYPDHKEVNDWVVSCLQEFVGGGYNERSLFLPLRP
jgi:hypothetical protein